jgi:hypothetical protein
LHTALPECGTPVVESHYLQLDARLESRVVQQPHDRTNGNIEFEDGRIGHDLRNCITAA